MAHYESVPTFENPFVLVVDAVLVDLVLYLDRVADDDEDEADQVFVLLVLELQADGLFVWLRARVLEEVILEPLVLQLEVLGLRLGLNHTFKVERDLMLDYAWCVFLRQVE